MKKWPLHKAYFWETAPFFRILLPFIAGIGVYDTGLLKQLSAYAILAATSLSAVIFIVSALWRPYKFILAVAFYLFFFLSAWLTSYIYDIKNDPAWFGNHLAKTDAFVGVLTNAPQEKDRTYKLDISIIGALHNENIKDVCGKAFVYTYKSTQPLGLHSGDTVILPNSWQRIKNAGNPLEFDYARYCGRNNIYYQQFLAANEISVYSHTSKQQIPWTIRMHDWCMHALSKHIHERKTLGIIQAMLIGDESNFDPGLRQSYAETGIIHIIAISGSHITFFFLFISFLLGWIRNKKWQWLKYAIALPLIWFYVVMAGAPPSAVRSAAMFSILAAGFMLQKENNGLNQLFATAFILLCAQPMWLFSVGFQLSFIAVLALLLFYKPIFKLYTPPNKVIKALWVTIAASIAAELLVAPLVIYYFHVFPLHFLLANIAAYCFMGLVLLLGIFIILFQFIPPLAGFLAIIAVLLTTGFNAIIGALQQLNPTSFRFLYINTIQTLLLYTSIAGIAIWLLKRMKPALFLGLSALSVFAVLLCVNEWRSVNQQRVVIYNLSRGSHIEFIKGKTYTILYTDTTTNWKRKTYVTTPAHIAWHAWRQGNLQVRNSIIQLNNQTILFVGNNISDVSFKVDYVIVTTYLTSSELIRIQTLYHPYSIIASGHLSRNQAVQLKEYAVGRHISLHTTILNGAYIIEGL